MTKYEIRQQTISSLLSQVQTDQIAIPELQRPFVWDSVKVRDLMDSLYKGYPVGYLITWQSVGAHLKGGQTAKHQQILIDGQQRVTALRAAVAGLPVMNKQYRQQKITIAFHPIKEEFATVTPVIRKDPSWIPDISELFRAASHFSFLNQYLADNPDIESSQIEANISKLVNIKNSQLGIISLSDELDVETVSEIFIRINSKGVPLSSADFAMSKIATYGERGRNLRKLIDYFCHLAVSPSTYSDISENDTDFAKTDYLARISWLKDDSEDLFDPGYNDVIRIAGLLGFKRGKASAIVSELSGRDPETRKVIAERVPLAYNKLEDALKEIVKKYNFENFIMTIKSAGFIRPDMVRSQNAMNFTYALYLMLRSDSSISEGERKRIVRRWFVLSLLTSRHSGSFESTWEQDIRRIAEVGAANYLKQLEDSLLTDGFWTVAMPQHLDTTNVKSPYFQLFLASQVVSKAKGFLSKNITVQTMLEQSGDIHHIVPKNYLQANGFNDKRFYNQVANYALTETAVNIAISNKPPTEYMQIIDNQILSKELKLGEIRTQEELKINFEENAVPENVNQIDATNYQDFLSSRRRMLASKIRDYYDSL